MDAIFTVAIILVILIAQDAEGHLPFSQAQLGALLSGLVTVLVPTLQFPNIVSLFGRTLLLIVLGFFS